MVSIARQSPLLRQSCLSAIRSPLVSRNTAGASQMVAFHASAKKQILPPLPRELAPILTCVYNGRSGGSGGGVVLGELNPVGIIPGGHGRRFEYAC